MNPSTCVTKSQYLNVLLLIELFCAKYLNSFKKVKYLHWVLNEITLLKTIKFIYF